MPLLLLFALHCATTPRKSAAAEVHAFEEETGLKGKASYVSQRAHPFEQAFIENDLPMLEYYYQQAIAMTETKVGKQTSTRLLGDVYPEYPLFNYRDKIMFGIMMGHAKEPAFLQSALWLSKKPLLLRMHIHMTTGASFSFSESGSSARSAVFNGKEERARSTLMLIDQNEPLAYQGLPAELAQSLIAQRVIYEDFWAYVLNNHSEVSRSMNTDRWLAAYNDGKRLSGEVPVHKPVVPIVVREEGNRARIPRSQYATPGFPPGGVRGCKQCRVQW